MRSLFRVMFLLLLAAPFASAQLNPEWTTPVAPFQIADNLFYVGSRDLAAYLVTTPAGNILINANLETSPPQIEASVEKLGFKWADTKIVLNGQAHYDHAAGIAEVLRETHARNMVMDADVASIRSGGHKDFSFNTDGILTYPAAYVDRVLHDGSTVELGGVALTAHKTAGHTPGCTTWTMRVHVPGEPATQMRDVVIAGGWSVLSQYRLAPGAPGVTYPGMVQDFRKTFATLRGLPCDIFLGAHGVYFGMLGKMARMPAEGAKVWIDPAGYRAAVDGAEKNFEKALAAQQRR